MRDDQATLLQVRLRNLAIGALVGAVFMLLALPASRPFFFGAVSPSTLDDALAATSDVARGARLPDPATADGQSMWFSVAADRIRQRRAISEREMATVENLTARAARLDPQNGYWKQADAALLTQMGHTKQAADLWITAGDALKWNDYQNDFLARALNGQRRIPAYAFAELCAIRQTGAVWLIEQGARTLLKAYWDKPGVATRLRLATVLNGTLIRQHARSIAIMRVGTEVIELAVSKPSDDPRPSKHHLLVARTKLFAAIARGHLGYDDIAIARLFDDADAENALTPLDADVRSSMQLEAAESAVIHTAPSAFLLCSLLGALAIASRRLLQRYFAPNVKRPWLRIGLLAVIAVIIALFLTSVYAAFALGFCILFAGSTPTHVRKRRPTWLGPLFWVTTSTVATVLLAAGSAGLVLNAPPSRILVSPVLPAAFNGSAAGFGVMALAAGFLFLCAPLWAFAQRLPTTYVLDIGLAQLGQKLVVGSLLLAVISGPTCVYLDRLLVDRRLNQQFRNEPLFYYLATTHNT